MASEKSDCRVQPSRDSLARSRAIWRRPCMGECREKQCVFFFSGHVFSYYCFLVQKNTQGCGAARGQTGTNWSTVLVVASSSWQGRERELKWHHKTREGSLDRKNVMCWQGAKETRRERELKRERERVGVGRQGSHGMPSLSSNRGSQQDSEQGAIADARALLMLTSTLDFDSCYVNLICDDTVAMTGGCCLPEYGKDISYYFLLDSVNLKRQPWGIWKTGHGQVSSGHVTTSRNMVEEEYGRIYHDQILTPYSPFFNLLQFNIPQDRHPWGQHEPKVDSK